MTKSGRILSWTHYLILLRVENKEARDWYEADALREGWSARTLDRNVGTLYYDRLLMSRDKEAVEAEMREKTAEYEANRLELVKNPVIAEFLGVPQDKRHTESELETAIIDNLQKFLMVMGKGYAFVTRQQHIKTDLDDFYIDYSEFGIRLICTSRRPSPLRCP